MTKNPVTKKSGNAKKYEKMTRQQRKVAIAKDVIANLHALNVDRGAYMRAIGSNSDMVPIDAFRAFGMSDQEILGKVKQSCTVCARGAMMLCKMDKFNHFELDNLECYHGVDDITTLAALEDAFTDYELKEIEAVFEAYRRCDTHEKGGPNDYDVWVDIKDPADRLLAIMQNIVDHKGDFKKDVAYVVGQCS